MNTFEQIYQQLENKQANLSLVVNYPSNIDPTATEAFFDVMENYDIPDEFTWLDTLLASADQKTKRDLFTYKSSDNDTIFHKCYDRYEFLEEIAAHISDIDFYQEGKDGLTVLELAATEVCDETFEHMLEIGVPAESLRDPTLLYDVSFDGREASDLADGSGLSIDEFVKKTIFYRISLLEEHGYTIPISIKDQILATEFGAIF